ncbi:uncharacterized protein LOC124955745 [Vespa velutina]|uniref:uncharacterized protein LOC124955745 n=1 Tax=Vespa velutina TaxID=202808 RepID=UPI001FB29AF3|nr:uncharacterized protein LOC124955745 [Vespa velutina]
MRIEAELRIRGPKGSNAIGERGPYVLQSSYPRLILGTQGPGQGTAIKAYRVAPRKRSIFPRTAQEKPSTTMKLLIVLFAVVVAVSAYPGHPWAAPIHAPAVHHVINVPQPAPIPPVHPQPLNIKVPHSQSVRIPYHGVHIGQPHLVGVEQYVPEPEVKVVAKPVAHHPW